MRPVSIVTAILLALLLVALSFAQEGVDFISIEGFVKVSGNLAAAAKVDMSHVKVELYATAGTHAYLKDTANCASSGYFVFQIYPEESKHDNFELRVVGPEGWTFEPSKRKIQLQDTQQVKQDQNFVFKGFTIFGKVQNKNFQGQVEAAGAEIPIHLTDEQGQTRKTKTLENGSFMFPSITPGKYTIRAVHQSWKIGGEIVADVGLHGTTMTGSITVEGYEIVGMIMSNSVPMANVQFTLSPCPQDVDCQTESDTTGKFSFQNIPSGTYTVTPYYKGFQVAPQRMSITLKKETLNLMDKIFEVVGFTVTGSIEKQLANVAILVNRKKVALSDKDGNFELQEISAGKKYSIEAQLEHYTFDKLSNVEFLPTRPQLEKPIRITHVNICGRLKFQPAFQPIAKSASLYQGNKKIHTAPIQNDGAFCVNAPSGQPLTTAAPMFEIKIDVTEKEADSGFAVKPASFKVEAARLSEPLVDSDIIFEQVLVTLSGNIKALSSQAPAPGFRVTLQSIRTGAIISTEVSTTGRFAFSNVVPKSSYKISVAPSSTDTVVPRWCWAQQDKRVDVGDQDVSNVELVQEGVIGTLVASHDNIVLKKSDGTVLKLKKGNNDICFKHQVQPVTLTPVPINDCSEYEKKSYEFDPALPRNIVITISRILVKGEIISEGSSLKSEDTAHDDTINIDLSSGPEKKSETITALKRIPTSSNEKKTIYDYQFWTTFGNTVNLKPSSSSLFLFEPSTLSFKLPESNTATQCPYLAKPMKAIRGVFLKGKVYPSIADAEIKVFKQLDNADGVTKREMLVHVKTNQKGEYRAGPLYSIDAALDDLIVTAEKQGFQLIQNPSNKFEFSSVRLSQVTVKVIQSAEQQLLPGVFLSLVSSSSDSTYRTSAITNEQGAVTFSNLLPGSYFVKPVLKEFVFEPTDISFDLEDGKDKEISIEARRVAFSVFGRVTSLNGKPLSNVIVEAHSQGQLLATSRPTFEETRSDQQGNYRIRGLKPNVVYSVRIRPTSTVEREPLAHLTISQTLVKDVTGADFLYFTPLSQTHDVITGQANLDPILYKNGVTLNNAVLVVEVELLAGTEPSSAKAIRSQRLTLSRQFQFILPKNGTQSINYYVRLSSNLNKHAYFLATPLLPVKNLQTGENQHVIYPFKPTLKPFTTEEDRSTGSAKPQFYFLLAIIVALIVVFNSEKFEWLFNLFSSEQK